MAPKGETRPRACEGSDNSGHPLGAYILIAEPTILFTILEILLFEYSCAITMGLVYFFFFFFFVKHDMIEFGYEVNSWIGEYGGRISK